MTDDKFKAKQKILGELESIRSLLNEDDIGEEPPLLTTPAEDETPVLAETLEKATAEGRDGESPDFGEDDIPVLQVAMDEQEPEPTTSAQTEEQPGLFDREFEPETESGEAPQPPSDANTLSEKTAPKPQGSTTARPASPKKTENPFLPKHIRDRLHANRRELAGSHDQMVQAGTAAAKTAATSEDRLVEELVEKFLPRIEAELRKRLHAVLDEQRQAAEKPPKD